jgi:hypothetical protein
VGEAWLVLAQAQQARGDRTHSRKSADRASEALSNGLGPDHRLTRAARALR